MKRLCVLLCALLFGSGCASEADKLQWEEVWRDLRGENMEMGRQTSGPNRFDKPVSNSKD